MPRPKKNGQKPSSKLVTTERRHKVFNMLLDGYKSKEIIDIISEEYALTEASVKKDIQWAIDERKKFRDDQVSSIVTLHLSRYEDLYKDAKAISASQVELLALQRKEKLMGLHNEDVNIQMNSVIEESTEQTEFNFDLLSSEEQNRLNKLLEKCK